MKNQPKKMTKAPAPKAGTMTKTSTPKAGLTAAQKKLPPFIQAAIAKKKKK